MDGSNEATKTQRVIAFMGRVGSKMKEAACINMMWGPSSKAASDAEQLRLVEMQDLIKQSRQDIDQMNRDYAAAKTRILTMRRNGADKMKIIPHMQNLKRLEARIGQKNKLLQNIEASADAASAVPQTVHAVEQTSSV